MSTAASPVMEVAEASEVVALRADNEAAEVLLRTSPAQAVERARATLARAQAMGIVETIPQSRFIIGIGHSFLTDYEACRHALEEAAAEARALGQLALANRCMNGLATIYERLGEFGRSLQILHECLALGREMKDNAAQIRALSNMGNTYAALDQFERADALFLEAIRLAETEPRSVLWLVSNAAYAEVLTLAGRHADSARQLEPCLAVAEADGHLLHLGFFYKIRAGNRMATGDRAGATEDLQKAEAIARDMLEQDLLCDVLLSQGQLALDAGDLAGARRIAREAVPLAERLGIKLYERRAFAFDAALASAEGQFERAYRARTREIEVERVIARESSSRKTQILQVEFQVEQHRRAAAAERERSVQLDQANQRLRQALEQLEHTASHDQLTGLLNRWKFRHLAEETLASLSAQGESVALCYIDLDQFKEVNDRLGHDAGDQLLLEFARRLRRAVRNCDLVARIGGDEFVVLVRELSSPDALCDVLHALRETLSEPFWIGVPWRAAASIGTAIAPRDGRNLDDLQRRADRLMYSEKHGSASASLRFDDDDEEA